MKMLIDEAIKKNPFDPNKSNKAAYYGSVILLL